MPIERNSNQEIRMHERIRLNNRIHHSTLLCNDVALSLHYDAITDRVERAADRDSGKGLYTHVYGRPCLFFKMALVERSRFLLIMMISPLFRHEKRVGWHILTFACWRCWLGGAYPACVMEQAGRFKTVVLAVIQAARVMEQADIR